jgi:hypothetical protein
MKIGPWTRPSIDPAPEPAQESWDSMEAEFAAPPRTGKKDSGTRCKERAAKKI